MIFHVKLLVFTAFEPLIIFGRVRAMLSQHSRSQALVKEEGCDRRGEPMLNLAILMEMKPKRKPLGHNPLSDAPY